LKLNPNQKFSIKDSDARLNIWDGSVRSGKTVAIDYRFIKAVGEGWEGCPADAIDVMVGKTLGALKRNVINPIIELVGSGNACFYPGKQEFRIWDKTIYTVGANDERSEGKIRGSTIRKALGDELTLWPESFFKMLDSRLSLENSQFFGSTNPGPPRHYLKVDYLDRIEELDLKRYKFLLTHNLGLIKQNPHYVEIMEKNYTGLWYKRFILGEWCMAEGSIYDFFDEKLHTISEKDYPDAVYRSVGVDYGTSNPTCFLLFGHNHRTKPCVWSEDEYFHDSVKEKRQKTDEEYVEDFISFIIGRKDVTTVFIDPAAASFKLALKRECMKRGMYIQIKDAENDVINGIRIQGTMLKSGDYKVGKRCKRTIADYYGYIWDAKAQERGLDEPVKTNGADHTKDAEKYDLYTTYGEHHIDYDAFMRN